MTVTAASRYFALIPCAGSGSRVGGALPKQYQLINGRAMLSYSVTVLAQHPQIDKTLLVLAPDDRFFGADLLSAFIPAQSYYTAYCGGASRHESVLNGLQTLLTQGANEDDWVLVHDAARPGLEAQMVTRLINALQPEDIGAILALPLADTLKRADAHQTHIVRTEAREGMWAAQTPQLFRIGQLQQALQQALQVGQAVTDEASAMELAGYQPKLVRGNLRNFKVTYPEDFVLASTLLSTV